MENRLFSEKLSLAAVRTAGSSLDDGADLSEDIPDDESASEHWCAMVPSVAIESLAAILSGNTTLHGVDVRSENKAIARFVGDSQQLAALGSSTAHRVFRELLQFQRTLNFGEIVGGVVELAAGVVHTPQGQNAFSKRTQTSTCQVRPDDWLRSLG